MTIAQAVTAKREQWAFEALAFNARHGANGGQFTSHLWANGQMMTGPIGCRSNQEIPVSDFEMLKANNWKIYV